MIRRSPHLHIDDTAFRVLWRKSGQRPLNLTPLVDSASWNDSEAMLSGEITLGLSQDRQNSGSLRIPHGALLSLDAARTDRRWNTVWLMRVWDPTRLDDSLTLPLYDDLKLLKENRADFEFTKSKRHKPKGWLAHEVTIAVAKRWGIRLGKVAQGTKRISSIEMENVSPLAPIVRAYQIERRATGQRFVLRWDGSRLNIEPLRRQSNPVRLGRYMSDVAYAETRPSSFCTVLTGRATVKVKGSKRRNKLVHIEKRGVDTHGYLHKQETFEDIDDLADLRKAVQRSLARRQTLRRSLSFSHPGVFQLRRGDPVIVHLPEEARGQLFKDLNADQEREKRLAKLGKDPDNPTVRATPEVLAYTASVSHQLSARQYDMSVETVFEDPLHEMYEDIDRRARERLERERKRQKKAAAK